MGGSGRKLAETGKQNHMEKRTTSVALQVSCFAGMAEGTQKSQLSQSPNNDHPLPDDIWRAASRGLGDLSEIPTTNPYNKAVLLQVASGSVYSSSLKNPTSK